MQYTLSVMLFLLGHTCAAGDVAEAFVRSVDGARSARIVSVKSAVAGELLATADAANVTEIARLFDLMNPVPHWSSDGKEGVLGPCFCAPEYVVEFVLRDGHSFRLYLKDDFWAVVPDDDDFGRLGIKEPTDIRLADDARARTRVFFNALEEKANRPPPRNAGSRPVSGDTPVSGTPSSRGPRG